MKLVDVELFSLTVIGAVLYMSYMYMFLPSFVNINVLDIVDSCS